MLTEEQVVTVHVEVAEVRKWVFDTYQQLERVVANMPTSDEAAAVLRKVTDEASKLADRLRDLERRLWWHSHTSEQLGEKLLERS